MSAARTTATFSASALAAVLLILCASAAAVLAAADERSNNLNNKAAAADANDDDLVSRACANATRYFCHLQLSKDACVSTLRSPDIPQHQVAHHKDLSDLTLRAFDLVGVSTTAADAAVGAAAATRAGGADAARRLQYCRLDYDDMARTVPECRRLVARYKAGGGRLGESTYDEMPLLGCVDRLRDAAVACWDQVRPSESLNKAVGKEVREALQRANVAKAIQEVMLGMVERNPWE
ncbi:unnamed protein product [Urochloa humidicola]